MRFAGKFGLYIFTVIVTLALYFSGVPAPYLFVFIFVFLFGIYTALTIRRHRKRHGLLNETCDPEAFVLKTLDQMEIMEKRKKSTTILTIDHCAGLASQGRYEECLSVLDSVDTDLLSSKNNSELVWYLNKYYCLSNLGRLSEAEQIYQEKFVVLPALGKNLQFAMKMVVARRHFYIKDYEEAKPLLTALLDEQMPTRHRLGIVFDLGVIAMNEGERGKAISHFNEVIESGNKLYIVQEAKDYIKKLQNN